MQCFPNVLDFGNVVVGSTVQKSITLQNESDCGLYYDLAVDHQSNSDADYDGANHPTLGKHSPFIVHSATLTSSIGLITLKADQRPPATDVSQMAKTELILSNLIKKPSQVMNKAFGY